MPALRVAVAASGGRDSTALLHCTVRMARPLGVEVLALHVHHGLMPQANAWLAQVKAQALRWGARFDSRRLAGTPAAGQSVEAWARAGRYQALAEMAQRAGCGLVLLAHHRRDQAETWLLQALRGAGPRGLAAMPRQARRQGLVWARPWLDMPRQRIEEYVRRHRLRVAQDGSNEDPRWARSRLRLQVWPALLQAFPDAETALAAAAGQAQQAAELAAEVAALDLPGLLDSGAFLRDAWLALPPARRRIALQAWLDSCLPTGVPGSLLQRLLHELPHLTVARWPVSAQWELRLYRRKLTLAEIRPPPLQPPAAASQSATSMDLRQPGLYALPGWPGQLEVRAVAHGGAAAQCLAAVRARARAGGERFQLTADGLPRSLKKQFQARGVSAWERQGPVLHGADGRLLFVPGLGIDARCQAAPGSTQFSLRWVPCAVEQRRTAVQEDRQPAE